MDGTSKIVCCSLFCFMVLVLNLAELVEAVEDDDKCSRVWSCSHSDPEVRFPFKLRDHHPPHCGHPDPGFELSCNENRHTVLNLPKSAKLFVKKIDYKLQVIEIYNPYDHGCLARLLLNNPHLNISATPFRYKQLKLDYYSSPDSNHYIVMNCSQEIMDFSSTIDFYYIACLSIRHFNPVIAIPISQSTLDLPACYSIGVTPILPDRQMYTLMDEHSFNLEWFAPNCTKCKGRGCRWKNENQSTVSGTTMKTTSETECFDLQIPGERRKQLIIGAIPGSFLLLLAAIGIYLINRSYQLKRENERKIKQFLEDYKSLKSTRYSYADIKSITNKFNQELGQGAFGTVYKGKLDNNILVAVKILIDNSTRNGEEFINEVASMGRIHHVNVARLVGFCADGPHRALVYEFLPNESLEKFIFPENESGKRVVLGLEKLQDIALGIAKGMEYLHHGCDQQILHFDIKPHNVLLDHNFVPKISDFGLAKLCSKEKSVVTMTAARGTMGYIAPEVASRNFGKPSYKSDVYSYGMLLLEMVGGRKNSDTSVENLSQVYFPEWIYKRVDQGEELRIDIEEEGQAKIAKKLANVALKCIQWHPMDRPSMKVVVQMLEGEGANLTVPPNPFASTDQDANKIGNRPPRPQNMELEIISEAE